MPRPVLYGMQRPSERAVKITAILLGIQNLVLGRLLQVSIADRGISAAYVKRGSRAARGWLHFSYETLLSRSFDPTARSLEFGAFAVVASFANQGISGPAS